MSVAGDVGVVGVLWAFEGLVRDRGVYTAGLGSGEGGAEFKTPVVATKNKKQQTHVVFILYLPFVVVSIRIHFVFILYLFRMY